METRTGEAVEQRLDESEVESAENSTKRNEEKLQKCAFLKIAHFEARDAFACRCVRD